MSLSYATACVCCSNHENVFLRSPRETTVRTRLTDCPSCHFWIHHCFRAVFLGCSQSVTSTVGTVAHLFCPTLYAMQLLLGKFHRAALLSEALPILSLHPIPFVCIKPPLTHCAWVHCGGEREHLTPT